jgi:hypothetical protein
MNRQLKWIVFGTGTGTPYRGVILYCILSSNQNLQSKLDRTNPEKLFKGTVPRKSLRDYHFK